MPDNGYIVQRVGNGVYIREIDPDSCYFYHTKRESWDFAQQLATPIKSRNKKREAADHITFIDINGKRKVVA